MIKKIVLNIVLLFTTYIVPLYIFYQNQNEYRNIDFRQNTVFIILFLGSVLIIYFDDKYRKQLASNKWTWMIFEVIGILGLLYSAFVLSILFMFRHCCGF